MKRILIWGLLLLGYAAGQAQTLLTEQFTYQPGKLASFSGTPNVSGDNWTPFNSNDPRVQVIQGSLSYTGYGASGNGNKIRLTDTVGFVNENVAKGFPLQDSGVIYYSMLIDVQDIGRMDDSYGDGFASFATYNNKIYAELFAKRSGAGFNLGVKAGDGSNPDYIFTELATNTTHLVVVAYKFAAGNKNDTVSVWINPHTSLQPAPNLQSVNYYTDDADYMGIMRIRQGQTTPHAHIDGIRVGGSWADIMGTKTAPPGAITALSVTGTSMSTLSASWKLPGGYDPATMSIVAFMKETDHLPSSARAPQLPPSSFPASTDFLQPPASAHTSDPQARCIYNGDGDSVVVTGLKLARWYSVVVYVVYDADTVWSAGHGGGDALRAGARYTTDQFSNPLISYYDATFKWNKPPDYADSNMTLLVFLSNKRPGPNPFPTPSGTEPDPSVFTADNDFTGNGTRLFNDTSFKCMYKGDGDSVKIEGIEPFEPYIITVFTVISKGSVHYYSYPETQYFYSKSLPYINRSSFIAQATGETSIALNWDNSIYYGPDTMNVLIFAKKGQPISLPSDPYRTPDTYTPSADFSVQGSPFRFDSAAFCVYSGDGSAVEVTGLEAGTRYYFLRYAFSQPDSVYSLPSLVSKFTQGGPALPVKPALISLKTANPNNAAAVWVKDLSYEPSNMTTLVFLKRSPFTIAEPTFHPDYYANDADFSGNGTRLQLDTAAKCIYKGDGDSVYITGLDARTTYYLMVYTVRDMDSFYAEQAWVSAETLLDPPGNLSLSADVAQQTMQINWQRPDEYLSATFTTLVFLKEDSAINYGTLQRHPGIYQAKTVFGQGSFYEHDSNAFCVYKNDQTAVTVSGLKKNTLYHVLVMIVRDMDSVYGAMHATTSFLQPALPGPGSVRSLNFEALTPTGAMAKWSRDTSYRESTMTTLVFVKPDAPITRIPDRHPDYYGGGSGMGGGTKHQYDSLARCVYNGHDSEVTVSNLKPATTYYIAVYAVRKVDSTYSTAAVDSIFTPLESPSEMLLAPSVQHKTVAVSWIKTPHYKASEYTTLVFVKANDSIPSKVPVRGPDAYSANVTLGLGSAYEYDPAAFCVAKGDDTSVTVEGLSYGISYTVMVRIVRDFDSLHHQAPSIGTFGIPYPEAEPKAPSGLQFAALQSPSDATAAWTKDTSYNNAKMTTLVFVKEEEPIHAGDHPIKSPVSYQATGDISLPATSYEFDPLAKCVYNGDGEGIVISGLKPATRYFMMLYTVRVSDSLYSEAVLDSTLTFLNSPDSFKMTAFPAAQEITITWKQPLNYRQEAYTTLVFVKEGSGIDIAPPVRNPELYQANALFGSGSPFESDPDAHCVFKGDQTAVTVKGLTNEKKYHAVIWLVRDADSAYVFPPRMGQVLLSSLPDTLSEFELLSPLHMSDIDLSGDTSAPVTFRWSVPVSGLPGQVPSYYVEIDEAGQDFSEPLFISELKTAASWNLSAWNLSQILHLLPGQTGMFTWRVKASMAGYIRYSASSDSFLALRGIFNGLHIARPGQKVVVYPNPATNELHIDGTAPARLVVVDFLGRTVAAFDTKPNAKIDISDLPRGTYFIRLENADAIMREKLILK